MSNKNLHFDDEFRYIVEKVVPTRICFGSGVHRDTNPLGKGLSSFQRRYAPEINPKVTPQTYDYSHVSSGPAVLGNKVRSNRGVSGIANVAPRFLTKRTFRAPSPTRYTVEPMRKTFKEYYVPFNQKLGKHYKAICNTPGPGLYSMERRSCRRKNIAYNFGLPALIPAVEVDCNPVPSDKCEACGEVCKDDYWHKNYTTFLCHICMEEQKVLREDYTIEELKKYQKIRICSYKHSHEGVQAYRQLYTTQTLKKRDRLESYLNEYISSFD